MPIPWTNHCGSWDVILGLGLAVVITPCPLRGRHGIKQSKDFLWGNARVQRRALEMSGKPSDQGAVRPLGKERVGPRRLRSLWKVQRGSRVAAEPSWQKKESPVS